MNPNTIMTTTCRGAFSLAFIWLTATTAFAAPMGDPVRGQMVYEKCAGCHSLDANRVGPKHRDVFGRTAGSLTDFSYSNALASSDITWDEETLDAWLTNPGGFIRGSRMGFRLSDAQDRADVIAYLKAVSEE